MVHLDKLYFTLKEVAQRWQAEMDDLAYMAENGDLRVSVRLYTVRLEEGVYEHDTRDGQPHRIPFDQSWFSGLQDLSACDAHKVFRYGEAQVAQFDAPGDAYIEIIEPSDAVVVLLRQLLIRREERNRVEKERKLLHRLPPMAAEDFLHDPEYRCVQLGDLHLALGRLQANIVGQFHHAARTGDGWCCAKTLLAEAGSASKRIQDVFKSQPHWRVLIESDGYRRCRLRIKLR